MSNQQFWADCFLVLMNLFCKYLQSNYESGTRWCISCLCAHCRDMAHSCCETCPLMLSNSASMNSCGWVTSWQWVSQFCIPIPIRGWQVLTWKCYLNLAFSAWLTALDSRFSSWQMEKRKKMLHKWWSMVIQILCNLDNKLFERKMVWNKATALVQIVIHFA